MIYLLWEGFQFSWPMMQTPQEAVGGAADQLIANNGSFTSAHQSMSFAEAHAWYAWLPLWNTIILLSSSVTVHIAHTGLLDGNKKKFNTWLAVTVALGMTFVGLQIAEYYEAYAHFGLTLNSGIYGSTFFMLTGFHGFHVFMGMTMLAIQLYRSVRNGHFTAGDHFGFEASSWYWHFVDVVWVFLFLFVYIL
jgi:cytochrome c oxidase subunit 3